MKKSVEIHEFPFASLDAENKEFIVKSEKATELSHAPYSEFYVGCVTELEDGSEILGANQENASFPSGLCAERVALFEASKNLDSNKVKRLAVFAKSTKYKVPKMLVPCAGCLQVISDIRNRQKEPIEIWMWDGGDTVYKADDVSAFLPFHFELEQL